MEYNKLIADLHAGDEIEGFYILKDAYPKTTAAGKPFLSATAADRTGTIDLKVWDYSGPVGNAPSDLGKVVKLRGVVSDFKGMPQITVSRIRLALPADHYDLSALVPVAPIDADRAVQDIRAMLETLGDEDYKGVAQSMLERHLDASRSIPAGKSG